MIRLDRFSSVMWITRWFYLDSDGGGGIYFNKELGTGSQELKGVYPAVRKSKLLSKHMHLR